MATLPGPRAKLLRSAEQLDVLDAESRVLVGPGRQPLRLHADRKTGWRRLVWALPESLLLRLGVLVGEIAHDLRSALDIAISELVRANGQRDDKSAFPIIVKWDTAGRQHFAKLTAGLTDPQIAVVSRLQPYQAGADASTQSLALLAEITNADKHRVVYPARLMITTYRIRVIARPGETARVVDVSQPTPESMVTLKTGTEVFKARVIPPDAKVNMQLDLTGRVLFSQAPGWDAIATVGSLRQTHSQVEAIVAELEQA